MKRLAPATGMVVLTLLSAARIPAQESEFQLPEYTEQQRWNRLANGFVAFQAALLELGRKHGMDASEVGAFVGEFFATGWLSGPEAVQFLVNYNANHNSWPGATSELLSFGPLEAQARFDRPWEAWVGLDRQIMGVRDADFRDMSRGLTLALSEKVGVGVSWEEGPDHDVLTFRTEYGTIGADDNLRYGRQSYLSWLQSLQLLDLQMKESGKTAREIGLEQGDMYAPSWGSVTPWQLFRGMTWNGLAMDRTMECEVQSASPEEVQARCSHTFDQRIGQGASYFDVTVDDFLENLRAFAQRVAEHRGMRWEETWEPGVRVIRVTMR